jgi:hydroxymethylpyrimidine pyrophosphatase-like HAD family hydrolase
VAQALVQLARKTGDRARDIEPEQMERIIEWIHQNDLKGSYIRYLQKVIPISGKEQTTVFGESLPSGLVMHA